MEKIKPTFFYTVFFLFILTYSSLVNGYDVDFWARLIAGMGFVQTGHVLKQDFLSYTPTHTWFDHEWGSGVIFYLTQHFFSSAGILLLQVALVFLIFFTVIKIINLRGVKTTSAYNFLFYFFAFYSMIVNLNEPIRCQMFSYLLFTIFIYILEMAKNGKEKPLWILPFLMIVWNNLHGGCVSGIGLIVLYAVGEFLNGAPFRKYIFALIPTVLVLPLNPWGISYITFLIKATTMPRPEIMEWWGLFSKFYLDKFIMFKFFASTLIFIEIIISAKSFSLKKMDKTKFIILATTLYLAVNHVKMVPFFVISSCCFLYDDFYTIFNLFVEKLRTALKINQSTVSSINKVKEVAIYIAVIVFILANLRAKSFEPLVRAEKYPLREVEFVKINNIKGRLFINFGLGSFASYKLYPNNLIYMDGRYEEVYNDDLLPIMKNFMLMNPTWQELFKKHPPDVIIIEKTYPAYLHLNASSDWKMIYEGSLFGVFVETKKAKKSYKNPPNKIDYYKKTVFDTDISFKKSS